MLFPTYVTSNQQAFYAKLNSIAKSLKTDANLLECVMWLESKLKPNAVNPNGGATGLIQFMPSTALNLGTTTAQLRTMSNVQQLDYVYQYFKPYTGRLATFADVYGVTFFPAMIGKPDTYILHTSTLTAEKIATANKIFDLDKNKQITAGEFRKAIYQLLPANIALLLTNKTAAKAIAAISTISIVALVVGGYFAVKIFKA